MFAHKFMSVVAQKSYIEMSLVQLVHLLAHHPDFGESEEDLKLFVPYIELFLDCVATSDNISFLYHIGQKFKATTDAVDPSCSKVSFVPFNMREKDIVSDKTVEFVHFE